MRSVEWCSGTVCFIVLFGSGIALSQLFITFLCIPCILSDGVRIHFVLLYELYVTEYIGVGMVSYVTLLGYQMFGHRGSYNVVRTCMFSCYEARLTAIQIRLF